MTHLVEARALNAALTALSFDVDSTLVVLQAEVLFSSFPLQPNSVIGTDWTINLNFPVPSGESFHLLGFLYSPAPPVCYESFLNKHTSQVATHTPKVQGISANFFIRHPRSDPRGPQSKLSGTPALTIWRSYPPPQSGSVSPGKHKFTALLFQGTGIPLCPPKSLVLRLSSRFQNLKHLCLVKTFLGFLPNKS